MRRRANALLLREPANQAPCAPPPARMGRGIDELRTEARVSLEAHRQARARAAQASAS